MVDNLANLVQHFIKKFDRLFYTAVHKYCHLEFPFKFFDEMVNKRDFLKIIPFVMNACKMLSIKGIKVFFRQIE